MASKEQGADGLEVRKQSGITLIEVLVSAVLVSMILLWISDSHMRSVTAATDSGQRTQAMWLAEEMLERIKLNPLLDLYQTEINGVTNISTYCGSRRNCVGTQCGQDNMVEYDVQQVLCNDNNVDGFNLSMMCFDTASGAVIDPCASQATVRGRITVSWQSKAPSRERQSTFVDALLLSIEQSLYFDGSNDYLQISGSLLSGSNFTVALWVRPDNVGGYRGFFGRQDGSTTSRPPSLWVASGGGLHFDSYDSSNNRHHGIIPNYFSTGQWTHVAWVKRGTQYLFYRNGVLAHTASGKPSSVKIKSNIWLGRIDDYFEGQLDEVQTYTTALSQGQVVDIMRGSSFPGAGLTLNLDFDGPTWDEARRDKSSNGRTVTLNGGVDDSNRRHAVH